MSGGLLSELSSGSFFSGLGPVILPSQQSPEQRASLQNITFSANATQTKIIPNDPSVDCGWLGSADWEHPCPAGAIPYKTYHCAHLSTEPQLDCSNIDPSQCPQIQNVEFLGASFATSTFTNGNATLTCKYSYQSAFLSEGSIKDCYNAFPSDNQPCNDMKSNFCDIGTNLSASVCKDHCSKNYCKSVDSYCTGENLNNPTCQHYVKHNTQGYNFSSAASSFCTGINLETTICRQYCFGTDGVSSTDAIDCDKELRTYCSDLGISSSICDCFRPKSYYDDKIKKNFSALTNQTVRQAMIDSYETVPVYCIGITPCATSFYKPHNTQSCTTNISICIASTTFNNVGILDVTCPTNYTGSCVNFSTKCKSEVQNIIEKNTQTKASPVKYTPSHVPTTPTVTPTPTPSPSHSHSQKISKPTLSNTGKILLYLGFGILLIVIIVVVVIIIHKHKKKKKMT